LKAVILAGGIGTRMRPLTYVVPKVMLPLGGKPLLEHTLQYLKENEIDQVVICVAYLKKQIMDYFKKGKSFGIKVEYAQAEKPMGTAGQLKTAEKYIDGTFLAMNGDIITTLNLRKLIESHKRNTGIGSIALKKFEIKIPYGHITVDSKSSIIKFDEKPTVSFLANSGIYVFEPEILDFISKNQIASLETEVFPQLIKTGKKLNAFFEEAYWADVGTMGDFERVDKELLSK